MANGDVKVKINNAVPAIFETMDYGLVTESLSEATQWLNLLQDQVFAYKDKRGEAPSGEPLEVKSAITGAPLCTVYAPPPAETEAILAKSAKDTKWSLVDPVERARIVYRFGDEVRRARKLLVQVEVAARGILGRDTEKVLPLLTDYLQYYSSYGVKLGRENSAWKPEGLSVGFFSDETPLFLLGCVLGPALAAGYNVILQTGPRISLAASLLIETGIKAGIPEDTIRLIPGNVDPSIFFTSSKVSVVAIFDNLLKDKFVVSNHLNKKLLNFSSFGTPMIVYDNADLDSACQAVTEAVWGYQGMTPWSVNRILVQENIFETFLQKLKSRIGSIKIGTADQGNVDVAYPLRGEAVEKLSQIVETAKKGGLEVFQKEGDDDFKPTLVIGGNVTNSLIKNGVLGIPVVSLSAFRSISESVVLANNTVQGLACSVWTESLSLANEVVRKLKVTSVWINSHGLFAADVPLSPYKSSGIGYFGGSEGFLEYAGLSGATIQNMADDDNDETHNAMETAIEAAKKAQAAWSKLPELERVRKFQTLAQTIATEKKNLSKNLPEKWLDEWVASIHDYAARTFGETQATSGSYHVVTFREPQGIVGVETREALETHNKKLIIAALVEGNAVLILNEAEAADAFYSLLAKHLPAVSMVPLSDGAVEVAALHRELNVYFGVKVSNVCSFPLKDFGKFRNVRDTWEDARSKSTLVKSVWSTIGQSFM